MSEVQLIGFRGELFESVLQKIKTVDHQFKGSPAENLCEYAGRICYDSVGKSKSRDTET